MRPRCELNTHYKAVGFSQYLLFDVWLTSRKVVRERGSKYAESVMPPIILRRSRDICSNVCQVDAQLRDRAFRKTLAACGGFNGSAALTELRKEIEYDLQVFHVAPAVESPWPSAATLSAAPAAPKASPCAPAAEASKLASSMETASSMEPASKLAPAGIAPASSASSGPAQAGAPSTLVIPDAERRARAAAAAEQRLQLASPGNSQPRQHQPITPGGSTAKEEKLGAAEALQKPAGGSDICRLRLDQGAPELEIKGAADQGSSSEIKGAAKFEIKVESTVQPRGRPKGSQTTSGVSVPLDVMEQDASHVAKMGRWTAGASSATCLTPAACSSSSSAPVVSTAVGYGPFRAFHSSSTGAPLAFVESSPQPVESSPAMESSQAVESSQQLREVLDELKTTRAQLQVAEAQLEHERQATDDH